VVLNSRAGRRWSKQLQQLGQSQITVSNLCVPVLAVGIVHRVPKTLWTAYSNVSFAVDHQKPVHLDFPKMNFFMCDKRCIFATVRPCRHLGTMTYLCSKTLQLMTFSDVSSHSDVTWSGLTKTLTIPENLKTYQSYRLSKLPFI